MGTLRYPGVNFPVSGFAAVIATGMLLFFSYNLSKINIPTHPVDRPEPVFIPFTKPSEPIKTVEPKVITPKPVTPITIDTSPDTTPNRDTFVPIPLQNIDRIKDKDIPKFNPGIHIQTLHVTDIFRPEQVDQKPRVLRPVTPVYPYNATVNGIEGRVVIRFVVNEKGEVENPKVVKADPEGVFEEAALAAIVKYKFMPAKIEGEKVKCSAMLPIGFELN